LARRADAVPPENRLFMSTEAMAASIGDKIRCDACPVM